ncbi:hypothetical protein [Paraburkholderia silvatlantica]|uniref:Uncharacterized protein n=1 Tax=Paraburkholderia silvatlantica TaxID=321895 RepID=A0ABR6FUG6_9BURK|nr:hypothetical protein [Paraburkholderia silvatlantica]MBB2931081.1 hypothetical protein [Paraburkholderia silvatlantica]
MMGEGGEAIGKSMADSELSVVPLRRKTSDRGKHMCFPHMLSMAAGDFLQTGAAQWWWAISRMQAS